MKRLFFLIIITSTFLTSCSEFNNIDNKNTVKKSYSNLGNFNSIHLDGIFEVEIYNSDKSEVIIKATNFQINQIKVDINQDTLLVKTSNSYSLLSKYKKPKLCIYLDSLYEFKSLKPIVLRTIDTLKNDRIYFYLWGDINDVSLLIKSSYFLIRNPLTGFGNYIIKGNTTRSVIVAGGSAHYNAKELKSYNTRIYQYSTANSYVNVQNRLKVLSHAMGNVYYLGNPADIIVESASSGKVIPYNN